jgi:two-component system, chemotaxis family, chemotaxis protein CheY
MKTLIVEDDLTSRLMLQKILSPYGECHMAMNGKEAVDAFVMARMDNEPYDLICLDFMMPEMDGPEALRRIRKLERENGVEENAGVKILMVTIVGKPAQVIDAHRAGATAHMVKPIDKALLLKHLAEFGLISKTEE